MDHTTLEALMRCEAEAVYRHIRHLTSPEESLASFFGRVVHEGVRRFYEVEQEGSGVGGEAPANAQPNNQPQVEGVSAANVGNTSTNRQSWQGAYTQPERVWQTGLSGVSVASAVAGSDSGAEKREATVPQPEQKKQCVVSPADPAAAACDAYWHAETESGRVVLAAADAKRQDHRTPELAAALVRVYASLYGSAASRGYDVMMNERYLTSGQECGIVDRVVRRHADGLLYVLDLKTSSWAPTKGYWRQWSNSQQAAIYLDLVEAELHEGVAGFWCDHIFVSGRKAGPEPGDFMQFGPVTYSTQKRAELREQRAEWRERFAQLHEDALHEVKPIQQSTRSCYRYQHACPFLGYCAADPADREAMIARDLQVGTLVERPWNPAERDRD